MTTIRMACLSVLILLTAYAGYANSNSPIVSWVDDNGVTHFGNPQFAPPEQYEAVRVNPTNGMAVPVAAKSHRTPRQGAKVVTLERTKLKNKRGFRGYDARQRNSTNSRRRR